MAEQNPLNGAERKQGFSFPQSMWGWLLCLVFLTALTAAVYMSFLPRTEAAVKAVSGNTPGAVPELLISSELPFDKETLAFFETLGDTVVTADAGSGFSDTGKRCFVCSPDLPYDRMAEHFILTEGRMPQNDRECVILSLSGAEETVGDILYLECGTYTVVGCVKNCRTYFSAYSRVDEKLGVREDPITYTDADCILYTVNASLPGKLAFLSGCRDMAAAKQRAEAFAADHMDAVLAAAEKERMSIIQSGLQNERAITLDGQVTALNAAHAELEGRIAGLEREAAAAEDTVSALDRTLQKELQDFNSEMERQEHHSANEVNMIEQKKKAQVRFDAMQDELDAARRTLAALYASREAAQTELAKTDRQLAEKQAELDAVLRPGTAADGVPVSMTAAFRVTAGDAAEYGCEKLLRTAEAEGTRFRLPALLLLIVTLTAAILTGYFAGRNIRYTTFDGLWFLLCTALVSVLGAAVGGCLVPQIRYPHVLPILAAVTAMPLDIGALAGRLLLLCAVMTLFTCGAAGLGVLLRRQK